MLPPLVCIDLVLKTQFLKPSDHSWTARISVFQASQSKGTSIPASVIFYAVSVVHSSRASWLIKPMYCNQLAVGSSGRLCEVVSLSLHSRRPLQCSFVHCTHQCVSGMWYVLVSMMNSAHPYHKYIILILCINFSLSSNSHFRAVSL